MPLPRINIRYLNGQLGAVPESRDGLLAIVVIGATAVSSTFTLGTAYRLRSPDDLADLGVTAENNARLVELVGQFYGESPEGTPVYVVGYASTESMYNTRMKFNLTMSDYAEAGERGRDEA